MEERPRRALLASHAAEIAPSVEALLRTRGFEVVTTRDVLATADALEQAASSQTPFELVVLAPLAAGGATFELDTIIANREDDFAHSLLLVLAEPGDAGTLGSKFSASDDWACSADEPDLLRRVELAIQRRELLRRLQGESITDFKTGLFNDRYFFRRLLEEVERTRRHRLAVALILIDFDDFRQINTRYQHQFGNFVLGTFGRKLRSASRRIDLPSRIGGDEFALLMPSTALDEATLVASRILSVVADCRFERNGESFGISVSMGVDAIHGEDRVAPEEFLERADAALYEAKRRGKGRFVLYPELGGK